ncbi:MAG TPA: GntR family transcriptional regulator [Rhodopila sp.]|jgi:DNA-binding GntR family transcriptional regulator
MPPTETKVATLASAAYGRLRREIIAVEIPPGSRLHTRQLCARYDMGLSPIREALSRLSSEGLVRQSDQRGFVVTQLTAADLDALTRTRIWLNDTGLRESIIHGDTTWEEQVIVSFHRLSRIPRFIDDARNPAWDIAHQAFHAALVSACRSPWLTGYCEQLFDAFERYRNLSAFTAAARPGHGDEHRAIMEAAIARDADKACHLLQEHYELSATLVRQQLSLGTLS